MFLFVCVPPEEVAMFILGILFEELDIWEAQDQWEGSDFLFVLFPED